MIDTPTTLAAAGAGDFATVLLVLGGMLVGGALLAGLAHRSFLSLTAVFVVAGFLLGEGGLEVLAFDAQSGFVEDLAILALVLILFHDGLEVEEEMLQREWHLPVRKLVLAMPLTAALVALLTKLVIPDFSWTEAFLVGALLCPTDPVLSSSVVTNARVPRLVRHSLNLESGMNDGLALPAVLALIAALEAGSSDFVWWEFVLQDLSLGLLFGVAVGYGASLLLPRARGLEESISGHQMALYALGTAFVAYGAAVTEPAGNGLIAVFVCAIVLGIRRPDIREYFQSRSEDIIEIVKLGIFLVFGSLLTLHGLFGDGLAAVAIAAFVFLVARPLSVFASLAGTGTSNATKAFMSWFGPKGVATMTFSLLVLSSTVDEGDRIFNLAALAVMISVIAHGLTDKPGVDWIAKRSKGEPRTRAVG